MRTSNVQFQHHLSAFAEALRLCAWLVQECFIKAHHSQLVHVQDEKAIIYTPVSALDLTQEFYWSFLRHLARSSLFPSYAGGGVPLGFVMVALSAHCFLTRLPMGTALIAMSSLPSSNPGQSDAHSEP